jgi:glycosyltransferase involved in cell wall biosynthesis
MKIAVVFPTCSTGGAKYLYLLLKAIIKLRPDYEITIWNHMKEPYAEKLIINELKPLGVKFNDFYSIEGQIIGFRNNGIRILNKTIKIVGKILGLSKEFDAKRFNQYDLFFSPWPYEFACPNLEIPMVCVPHDFNYTHHFGLNIYGYGNAVKVKKQHEKWFRNATPIVSTNFMAKELKNTFPWFEKEIDVVHLSTLNDFEKLEDEKIDKILADLGIDYDYVLSASSVCYHKNFNILYSGYYYLKQKYPNVKLLLTGWATESCKGESNSPHYIDSFSQNPDVKGLGIVSDEVLIALMKRAKMVVNTSLYEAGNGSGLDAWGMGVPVVMSDIESFREQIDVLGVKAQLFDAQCGKDMAEAMIRIIDNPEQTLNDVQASKDAIANYSWEKVAQKYLHVFDRVIKDGK